MIQTLSFHFRIRSLSLALFLVCWINADGQERCATKAPSSDSFDQWISQQKTISKFKNLGFQAQQNTILQIPLVFHIIHKGEPIGEGTNLSQERIEEQLKRLNDDFRRTNADAVNTPDAFLPVAADTEIEFVLAKTAPDGSPTSGITRVLGTRNFYNPITNVEVLRSETHWNPEDYLNVYCADLTTGFLGFASFPISNITGNEFDEDFLVLDGVTIDYQFFGVNEETSSFASFGRTLTHEIGHYLGLRHIWGERNCNVDDYVDDTPPADDDNGGTESPCTFPNPDDESVCETPEMFQNYMDYTDDICMNLFTSGQADRMRIVLENAIRRTSLLSSKGLTAEEKLLNNLAIKRIISPRKWECEPFLIPEIAIVNTGSNEINNATISVSINNELTETLSISTSLQPLEEEIIEFAPINILNGESNIQFEILSVNNAPIAGSSGNTASVIVNETSQRFPNYFEDFEGSRTANLLEENSGWEVMEAPRETVENNALIFNASANANSIAAQTIFKTPVFDFSSIQAAEISFKYAYAYTTGDYHDGLALKVSTDCGATFTNTIFVQTGRRLRTKIAESNNFIPQEPADWDSVSIRVSQYAGSTEGIQFAFVGMNGGGNNIYLDDLQVPQLNDNAKDVTFTDVSYPLVTCDSRAIIQSDIVNLGFENLSEVALQLTVGEGSKTISLPNLNVISGRTTSFTEIIDLNQDTTSFEITVLSVNGEADESSGNNSFKGTIIRDLKQDNFPYRLDASSIKDWVATGQDSLSLWESTDTDGVFKANGFDQPLLGKESWFVSPIFNTGGLDSVGLSFDVAHAQFPSRLDKLSILLSEDCGNTFDKIIFQARSDVLASFQSTTELSLDEVTEWKNFTIPISPSLTREENIRLAFVFTSANGNNLFIDRVEIRANENPSYVDVFRVFPNPATVSYKLGLNLPIKQTVKISLMNMSGRLISQTIVSNGLNQIINFQTPPEAGLYFINVSGDNFSETQRLFVNP